MVDMRRKNVPWSVADKNGKTMTWDEVQVAVLMDIRDELQKLNTLLHCQNFTTMPHVLRRIDKRLAHKIKL